MPDVQYGERAGHGSRGTVWTRPANGILLLHEEARSAAGRTGSPLGDPDLAGNPVALAHARAARRDHASREGAGSPIGTALVFLVVAPAIVFLVSNPLGWLTLFGLCLGFGFLFGFGGIL